MPISSDGKDSEDDATEPLSNENIKKIAVKDYIELITVTEANEEGEVRYALDDYIELESSMNSKIERNVEHVEELDEEIVFEKKVIVEDSVEEDIQEGEIDPMNTPISQMLKERAEERKRKMKDFNYKFNNAKIDDIERVPAYKRQGVDLNEVKHSSETDRSRTSVGLDDNDDIQLRNNNSFLHDNVD